ncbi:MAG TPA: transglutaminase-like domain-containing protein [Clostridia bacterium]|nr:transglutaminase-like domain-containing protein [Clostridia bacterium]
MKRKIELPGYYVSQSIITEPGRHAALFEVFSKSSIKEIVEAIHGLFLHIFWAQRYGVNLTDEQQQHVQSRNVPAILDVITGIDNSPLDIPRSLDKRFIGNCRDYSVFLCSILRSKGIPARARCGFGTYFIPNHYEDHWMCEYWNNEENRWVSVDAQLDRLQRDVLGIGFDPLDMPAGQFVTGCEAWKLCRSGAADPDTFGIFDMKGLGFVRGDMLRDIASLKKVELLPWDCWGLMLKEEKDTTAEEYALLDKAADLASKGDMRIFDLYEETPGLRASGTIMSFTGQGVREFTLD